MVSQANCEEIINGRNAPGVLPKTARQSNSMYIRMGHFNFMMCLSDCDSVWWNIFEMLWTNFHIVLPIYCWNRLYDGHFQTSSKGKSEFACISTEIGSSVHGRKFSYWAKTNDLAQYHYFIPKHSDSYKDCQIFPPCLSLSVSMLSRWTTIARRCRHIVIVVVIICGLFTSPSKLNALHTFRIHIIRATPTEIHFRETNAEERERERERQKIENEINNLSEPPAKRLALLSFLCVLSNLCHARSYPTS